MLLSKSFTINTFRALLCPYKLKASYNSSGDTLTSHL